MLYEKMPPGEAQHTLSTHLDRELMTDKVQTADATKVQFSGPKSCIGVVYGNIGDSKK